MPMKHLAFANEHCIILGRRHRDSVKIMIGLSFAINGDHIDNLEPGKKGLDLSEASCQS